MSNYIETATITHETAQRVVNTALAEGARIGVRAVVTVVDPGMTMVSFGKADGATPHSVETSLRKANTAASTRRTTGWMSETFALQLPLGTNGRLTNILGGVPLSFDGKIVGGLGVAGGTPDQDAAIAEATIVAVGADA